MTTGLRSVRVLVRIRSTVAARSGSFVEVIANTGYILIAIPMEERDLVGARGEPYVRYKEQVPMILPIGKR